MKTPQLIKKVEKKIKETEQVIITYEQQLASHKNLLQTLIQKLQEIKINQLNNYDKQTRPTNNAN